MSARARSAEGRVSVGAILLLALPVLTVVLAALAALGVGAVYEARQRYEDELAQSYRAEVAVRHARAAATVELALASAVAHRSPARRRASADLRRAEAAARAAVRGDPPSEHLVARQLAAQRRARAALRAPTRARARARVELGAALRKAEDSAAGAVRRQRRLRAASRDVARAESRAALARSAIAGGLAVMASLSLVWLLLRSMHGPLASLVRTSRRLADDDLSARVEPRGPTEIVRLADAFNAMAARLEARHEELQAALARAEEANRAKSRFLSRVSHELRTPLNAILGFSQLLEMEELTEGQRASLEQVLGAGRHLLVLVDDVLEISRIDTDGSPLANEPVDVAELVREVVAMHEEAALRQRVSVDVELPESEPLVAHADRAAVRKVLIHLVDNGIKYNNQGGDLRIAAGRTERRVHVVVADTGPGIAADQLEKLFVPFERLEAEAAGIGGMGMGLAISQRLARDMDGTLEVTSEVGLGTRFTLALPVAASSGGGATLRAA